MLDLFSTRLLTAKHGTRIWNSLIVNERVSGYHTYYNCIPWEPWTHNGAGRVVDEAETGRKRNVKEEKNYGEEKSRKMYVFIFLII
jgi:hypothetical protein